MRWKAICLFFPIVLALSAAAPFKTPAAEGIKWRAYQEGMALGKQKGKKVFLHFYADWCRYCQDMEKKTFKDSSVVAYLNNYFIAVKVDSDKEKTLVSDYRVKGLPATWFVAEDGEPIGTRTGFISSDQLMPILKYVHTNSYEKNVVPKIFKNQVTPRPIIP